MTGEHNEHQEDKLVLYQILQAHRQHAERVFWSRIQTLHAIQAGVLAGGFYLLTREWNNLAIATFSLGAILTLFLGLLARNDWSDAKVNRQTMCRLSNELKFKRTAGRYLWGRLRSHYIMLLIIIGFLVGDIVLAIMTCKGVSLLQ